jgi:serine/threonine-protein kinase
MVSSRRACGAGVLQREGRHVKVWKFLVLFGSLAAAGLLVLAAIHLEVLPRLVHSRPVVTTPDVRDLTLEAAKARLAELGLEVQTSRERPHPTIAVGCVLDQTPAPGSPLRRGRDVKVVLSSGPAAGGVPSLAGLSRRQAELTLQREAFRLGRIARVHEEGRTEEVVLAQNPPAGSSLEKGKAVDLVLAVPAPAALLRMPDLRGLPVYRAEQEIRRAGCVMAQVKYERKRDRPAETILEQTPEPGGRIEKGARIELVAAKR